MSLPVVALMPQVAAMPLGEMLPEEILPEEMPAPEMPQHQRLNWGLSEAFRPVRK